MQTAGVNNNKNDSKFYKELFQDYLVNGKDVYFGICNSTEELFDYLNDMKNYDPASQNRVVAGYCRKWVSKKSEQSDWVENSNYWNWNLRLEDWINAPDLENETGSIRAVQGINLNYARVIIGKDLTTNEKGELVVDSENYYDNCGKFKKSDPYPLQFDRFIKSIYYVLLTRGIDGIRAYFEDKKIEKVFKKFMGINS